MPTTHDYVMSQIFIGLIYPSPPHHNDNGDNGDDYSGARDAGTFLIFHYTNDYLTIDYMYGQHVMHV